MKIKACYYCGSQDIRGRAVVEGQVPYEISAVYICNTCGHQGVPYIFEKEEEYEEFLKALREDKDRVEGE